ncbi:ATP-grasp domain-containing protein [Paucibacter sp. XJ19-41]|uniref:ATP-grasp domain-containing protein n=1 Tax=Paucibacter sp. XJ19-41 TaxID=2927824 RepID=UPI00234A5D2F|nr:ATP-grasp domain-containing protein [Paucibacter sp. XJ19-41]MDC6169159.1 ATP-grasp domain-containing protein [Paucibacter sp. XJ19-41]
MTEAAVLLLGAGRGQLAAYAAARRLGLVIVGIDPDPRAPGLALARQAYSFDLADANAVIAVARRHQAAGIFTMAADYPMPALAASCAEMSLPGPSPEATRVATHKRWMREAFARHGVPCPVFGHADSLAQAIRLARALPGDAIFKPALSHGGRGVSRVAQGADEATLNTAFEHALRHTRADGVMVEAFVDGPEFSVETLSWRGQTRVIAITEKLTSGAPHYVEIGHRQPSVRSAADQARLAETAVAAVQALGITNAAGHSEMRLGPDGPVMMETGARLGGGFITSDLVPLSTGIDLVEAALAVALGREPDLRPQRPPGAAAIRFVTAAPGIVEAISGLAELQARPGVERAELYCQVGDLVPPLTDASARCGHIICSAASAELAASAASEALVGLRLQTGAPHG